MSIHKQQDPVDIQVRWSHKEMKTFKGVYYMVGTTGLLSIEREGKSIAVFREWLHFRVIEEDEQAPLKDRGQVCHACFELDMFCICDVMTKKVVK